MTRDNALPNVSTNLVMASLGEETRASTRGPANHNAVALSTRATGSTGARA